jgi:uncharacterized integral membrane protein
MILVLYLWNSSWIDLGYVKWNCSLGINLDMLIEIVVGLIL